MPKQYRRTLVIVFTILALMVPVMVPAATPGDVLTGVTTGQTKIYKQDIPGAKSNAVSQALELAVQNAFASLVSRQVFASNLEFLYDRLVPGAAEYVITYRVLDEMEYKGSYLVGVESKIDLARMRQRLEESRIIRTGQEKPVVLLLIAEQTPEDLLPRYWWGKNPEPYTSLAEAVIIEELTSRSIPMAHIGPDYPDPSFYAISFQGIYDARAAMDLAAALKADLVVLGKAGASESFNRMGDARTFDGVIDLKVFDVASEKEVLQVSARATSSSDMKEEGAVSALTKAARDGARDLGTRIEAFWAQNLRKESHFDVAVEGENFLPRFIALKRRFKEIRDIVNLQPKEIGSDSAVVEVLYKGGPEQFADAVLLKTFAGFGLEIVEVTPEMVSIRFVDKTEETEIPAAGAGAEPQTVPREEPGRENTVQ